MQTKNTDGFAARLEAMMSDRGPSNAADSAPVAPRGLGGDFSELAEAWPYLMESERNQVISVVRAMRRG